MTSDQMQSAQEQLKTLQLFESLYVIKSNRGTTVHATYRVTEGQAGQQLFYRTVDLMTGLEVNVNSSDVLVYDAVAALLRNYSVERVRFDGMIMMQELCVDHHQYAADVFPSHDVFGKCIYYADVDELNIGDDCIAL